MRYFTPLALVFAFVAITPVFAADVGVRIRFGLTDTGNTVWDGNASVSPGTIERIDGWRFQEADRVVDQRSWKASTRPLTVRRSNNPKKAAKKKKAGAGMADNGIFLVLTGVAAAAGGNIDTKQGDLHVSVSGNP
jgi:hypothetical protein